jgi:hypothetical protein
MGYDLRAYVDVDQKELERFVVENAIDRTDWEQMQAVKAFVASNYGIEALYPMVFWNDRCSIFEVMCSRGTNFIRDDPRFSNRRYHKVLEAEHGMPFPFHLMSINHSISTDRGAVEVARDLRVFFSDDEDLMDFAQWLEDTAKVCSTYELSC